MSMTIKQLADQLGVSKTAIRKHLTEDFRANHVETDRNGVLAIDSDGCELIAEIMGKTSKLAQSSETEIPETAETSEYVTIPRSLLTSLEEQLLAKDRQLEARDKQIADLTETIKAQVQGINGAQALHAGTMQQITGDVAAAEEPAQAAPPKKGLFEELFGWLKRK